MDPKRPLFEIRRSPIHGRGGFALRTIRRGTRVMEYTGERISQAEASRRYVDTTRGATPTYLFELDDDTCLDAAVGGSEARFLNHGCEPNCETAQVGDKIFIYSIRTIHAGDELVYDYRYVIEGELDAPTLARLYACHCGAPRCRGTIIAPAPRRRPRPSGKRATRKR